MVWRTRYVLVGGTVLVITAGLISWHFWSGQGEVLKPDGGPVVTVMDFGRGFPLDPLPSGWQHRKFWARSPMTIAFTVKEGVPSMRFETHDSASMLFRHVDIDLAAYTMLLWCWFIELPIRSPLDERTREGDDHPARLFLRFVTDRDEKRAMEVIWGNRLKPGDYKYIGGFPHFVGDAGDERVGRWFDEKIDLAAVYAEIRKDAAPAHLTDEPVESALNREPSATLMSSSMAASPLSGHRAPTALPQVCNGSRLQGTALERVSGTCQCTVHVPAPFCRILHATVFPKVLTASLTD